MRARRPGAGGAMPSRPRSPWSVSSNGSWWDETDTVRFTVGRVEVTPNSPNTVPGRAFFTVDLRHPDAATLARLGDQIEALCRANARGCEVTVVETIRSEPATFSPKIV